MILSRHPFPLLRRFALPHSVADPDSVADRLLAWYDRHRRSLPWRVDPGVAADPYKVWLSEIMLQQTTVASAGPYFRRFLDRWPTIHDLAAAPLDDVLHGWQGLGYYARARNMHRCAQELVAHHDGCFPDTEEALLRLPGIGAYTAAAVAAIAFGRPATVVDGNVERVVARLKAIQTPLPQAKAEIRAAAARLTPQHRPGDYAQAMMDLGATVCTPRSPRCMLCPLEPLCAARREGIAADLPRRAARAVRPVRRGAAFWLRRADGAILLRRRADKGLLGGMMEVPSTAWRAEPWDEDEAVVHAPLPAPSWRLVPGAVRHVFTHFELQLTVLAAETSADAPPPAAGLWVPVAHLDDHALPSLMKKVVRHALAAEGEGGAAP